MMARKNRTVLRRFAATSLGMGYSMLLFALPVLTATEARAALDDLVHVKGTLDNGETKETAFVGAAVTGYGILDQTCSERNKAISDFMAGNGLIFAPLLGAVEQMASVLEWKNATSLDATDFNPPCPKIVDGDFHIFYTTCSMTMFMGPQGSPVQMLRWTVPPEATEAEMVLIDGKQGIYIGLETALETINARLGQGNVFKPAGSTNASATEVTPLQETKTYSLSGGEVVAQRHNFTYEGRPPRLAGIDMLNNMFKVEKEGWAYLSRDVPGLDVVQTFYANFVEHVVPAAGGAATLLGGMVEQMSAIVDYGFPLEGHTTSKTGVGLNGGAVAGLMQASSTDTYTITDVTAAAKGGSDLCAPLVIPEDFEIIDLGEMLSGVGDGDTQSLSSAMATMNEAMANMTPEERAAMQQAMSGVGALLGGVAGAAPNASDAGGAMPPDQAAAMQQVGGLLGGLLGGLTGGMPGATAPPATPPAAAPARSGPSLSSALMSDNLTQSAQNMLQALGYDPGSTNGEMSVETTIAISQFQAERGLEATGEVTPQLVGILAAAVDAL